MDAAFTATGSAPAPSLEGSTLMERISCRVRLALVAWSHRAEQRRSREYLIELHERRQEAARLREELFRDVTLARLG